MSHNVQVNADNIVIADVPYQSGDTAVVSDEEFAAIPAHLFTDGKLTDLGAVSGGGGFHDGQSLLWYTLAAGLAANGGNDTPVTQDNTAVYGPDGAVLLEIPGAAPTIEGVDAGDDFILQGPGTNANLYFKKAGLYLVTFSGPAINGLLIQGDYLSVHGTRGAHWQGESNAQGGAVGELMIAVGAADVASIGLSAPAGRFSPYVYNNTTSVQDVAVTLSVMRVI